MQVSVSHWLSALGVCLMAGSASAQQFAGSYLAANPAAPRRELLCTSREPSRGKCRPRQPVCFGKLRRRGVCRKRGSAEHGEPSCHAASVSRSTNRTLLHTAANTCADSGDAERLRRSDREVVSDLLAA